MCDCTIESNEEANRVTSAELAQHEGLVRWVVRRQWLGDLSVQDALHEGRIGLWALWSQLPARLRQIVVAHHGLDGHPGQSFAAIGAVLGVSRQRVHQLHSQAMVWLAHPERSLALRRLVGRCRRQDYQRTLARQHHAARQQRRWRAER
jgi:hypothetical protein